MPRHLHHLTILAIVACIACLTVLPSARAADGQPQGDYLVYLDSTWSSFWSSTNSGGPWAPIALGVVSQPGHFVSGQDSWMQLSLPDPSLSFYAGRIAGNVNTLTPGINGEVDTISSGGVVSPVFTMHSTTNQGFDTGLAPGASVRLGLRATTTGSFNAYDDDITMSLLHLGVKDSQAPTLSLESQPSPSGWHGPGCMPWAVRSTDGGSGVTDLSVVSSTTGAGVDGWQDGDPATYTFQPGAPTVGLQGCLDASTLPQGPNRWVVQTDDYSGMASSVAFTANVDTVPPALEVQLPDVSRVDTSRPGFTFSVHDVTSGLQSVVGNVDGLGASTTANDLSYRWDAPEDLSLGLHAMHIRAIDNAGNVASLDRTFTVVDDTPPPLTIDSTTELGGGLVQLGAHASDSQSGVNPASWSVTADGSPEIAVPAGNGMTSRVGPLAVGNHVIHVHVTDGQGNASDQDVPVTITSTGGGLTAAALGASTGLDVEPEGTDPVDYGDTVTYLVTAAESGRPLGGYRVSASYDGGVSTTGLTDAQGVAEIAVVARRSGTVTIGLPTSDLGSQPEQLDVRPRLSISASSTTPAAGANVTITGTVVPASALSTVALQAAVDDSWYPLRRSVIVTGGKFTTTVSAAVAGSISVRVASASTGDYAATTSNPVTLQVGHAAAVTHVPAKKKVIKKKRKKRVGHGKKRVTAKRPAVTPKRR